MSGGTDSVDGDTISYTIKGLEEYITYTITVTATNAVGSAVSEHMIGRTNQAGKQIFTSCVTLQCMYIHPSTYVTAPSAPPTYVNTSAVTTTSITVQWGAVDCINQNGNITGHSVQYGVQGSAEADRTVEMAIGDSSGGMYTISGLSVATVYTVEVAAVNSDGIGVYSDPITAQTLERK